MENEMAIYVKPNQSVAFPSFCSELRLPSRPNDANDNNHDDGDNDDNFDDGDGQV